MPDNKDKLRQARANARPATAAAPAAVAKEKQDKAPRPRKPPRDIEWITTDPPLMPEDCPLICLGRDKRRYAVIDTNQQFLEVDVNQLSADGLADLFANDFGWLWGNFRKFNKDGVQIGWDKERAKIAFMIECAKKGPFNFEHKVRGEGAHHDDEGRLHWHLGNQVLVAEEGTLPRYESSPLVHGYVYPRGTKQPMPAAVRAIDGKPMQQLFELLKRWHWSRGGTNPDLDARMLLGWIGCAIIGGALNWRPTMWLRGPRAAGKSTLQIVLQLVLGGDGAVVKATDASSAGIYTALKNRSIPVMVDEAEPRAGDNRHMENSIALARASSSGGVILRSGSNLESRSFSARSCFFFSGINVPPLETADMTRIVMLRILPLKKGGGDLVPDPAELGRLGAQIRRIVIDAWPLWPKILSAWRHHFMGKYELEARVADTWGSVLAMADLLLNAEDRLVDGEVPIDELDKWIAPIAEEVKGMLEERGTDHDKVVKHLMTSELDGHAKGQRWLFETMVAVAASWAIPGDVEKALGNAFGEDGIKPHRANSFLVNYGFKVVQAKREATTEMPSPEAEYYLACHKDHRGAKRLFEDSIYKNNGHLQQLEQIPGAYNSRQRFAAGQRDPAVMVPVKYLLGDAPIATSPATSHTPSLDEDMRINDDNNMEAE